MKRDRKEYYKLYRSKNRIALQEYSRSYWKKRQRHKENGYKEKVKSYNRGNYFSGSYSHGLSRTKFYRRWASIKDRCYSIQNKNYHHYGGRGIEVCDRWLKFENFRDDMYESFLEHEKIHGGRQTSIDRIDNNGDYCKDNCRWVTHKEQSNNRRQTRKIRTHMGRFAGSIAFANQLE